MWLNTSGSHAQPPADTAGDPSQYGLLGARLEGAFDWGSLLASGRYGHAVVDSGGRWLQADAAVVTGRRFGPVALRARVSAFGLRYVDPYEYDAGGVGIRPALSVPAGRLVLTARPVLTFGGWSTPYREGELRVVGSDVEASRAFGALTAVVSAGASSVENGDTAGTFARLGADLILDRGRWTAVARIEAQRSPSAPDLELGGGIQLSWTALPGVQLHGYAGRRVTDPLFGTAGSLNVSITASVRTAHWAPRRPPPVVAVGEPRAGGRLVHFAIRAPEADSVSVSGDFSGWEPVPMEEGDDGWWRLSRVVEPGLHHFGFLVDGLWAIPEDAPGVVEDGWGRRNASVVVEL